MDWQQRATRTRRWLLSSLLFVAVALFFLRDVTADNSLLLKVLFRDDSRKIRPGLHEGGGKRPEKESEELRQQLLQKGAQQVELGGVDRAPLSYSQAICRDEHYNDHAIVRDEGIYAHSNNPSVLVEPLPNSKNCTHNLIRVEKTGSTAFYNWVMENELAHEHICWENGYCGECWHKRPRPGSEPSPIILTLREPFERLLSMVAYYGWESGSTSPIDMRAYIDKLDKNPHDLGAYSFLYKRNNPKDVVLCSGCMVNESLISQLRRGFNGVPFEDTLKPENINHRKGRLQNLTSSVVQRLHEMLEGEYRVWNRYCGDEVRSSISNWPVSGGGG